MLRFSVFPQLYQDQTRLHVVIERIVVVVVVVVVVDVVVVVVVVGVGKTAFIAVLLFVDFVRDGKLPQNESETPSLFRLQDVRASGRSQVVCLHQVTREVTSVEVHLYRGDIGLPGAKVVAETQGSESDNCWGNIFHLINFKISKKYWKSILTNHSAFKIN